jgi:recombination protein RecR
LLHAPPLCGRNPLETACEVIWDFNRHRFALNIIVSRPGAPCIINPGQKSAQRIAFHVLRAGRDDAGHLAQAILDVKDKLGLCSVCNNISDRDLCLYCSDARRDPAIVCVVEEPHSIVGIETTRQFEGRYHVLHGALSPLRGIGPDALKIRGLVERIGQGEIKEAIIATNPTVEGEATAVYLARLLKPLGVKVTRIAMGIPVGSDLEFADEVTISKAMEGRREM